MPITIIDVAKLAGVSKSTVSLVINDSPLIKAETKARVREAIRELGYVTNMAARSLSTSKTSLIGIIALQEQEQSDASAFDREPQLLSQDVVRGVPLGLEGEKYGLVTEYFNPNSVKDSLPELIESRRVDGVILIGSLHANDIIKKANERGIPAVAVGRNRDGTDSVYADVKLGIHIATERVILGGTKTLCYINCPSHFSSHKERLLGFESACRAYPDESRTDISVVATSNSGKGGYDALRKIWESGTHPDAIVAANDTIALGVMRYIYELGLKIPEDISVIGYDSSLLGEYASPALTSVDISKEKTGKIAAELLMSRISDPEGEIRKIKIDPVLVERNTVRSKK